MKIKSYFLDQNYKLKSFQVYGDEAIVYFIPKKKKNIQ